MKNSDEIKNSISKVSHIHSITADFLAKRLIQEGLPEFATSHGNILFQLSITPSLTMKELSSKINRDKSTTTVLVRKLEKAGFIQESVSPTDRRSKILTLTEKGREYNQATAEISADLINTFYKDFSDLEKELFCNFLNRIEQNFK